MMLLLQNGQAGADGGVAENVARATDQASAWADRGLQLLTEHGPAILAGLLVYFVGRWIARMIVRLTDKVMSRRGIDETLRKFLVNILSAALTVLVVLSAIQTIGIETTSFIAVLGAATLAIGFALQGSLSNFAAGVMIILFRPFKSGDFVEAGGTSGIVEEVGVFATAIRSPDNKKVIVPNSSITNGTIVNYSAKDTRRVDMKFGIGYGDDIKKAKAVLEEIVKGDERVLAEPAPTIAVSELGDSSVNLICRPWVKTADYWNVYWDLHEAVKLRFDAEDITIPFPQRDVHMHSVA